MNSDDIKKNILHDPKQRGLYDIDLDNSIDLDDFETVSISHDTNSGESQKTIALGSDIQIEGLDDIEDLDIIDMDATFDLDDDSSDFDDSDSDEEEQKLLMFRPRVKVKKKRSRRFIIIRRLIIFAILEVFAIFGISTYAKIKNALNQMPRPEFSVANVENTELTEETIERMSGYWNIAVFGVDSRNGDLGKGNNSDVIMVVSINNDTGEIKIASVFRDSYLDTGNGTYNKINSAYTYGGPEQAVKAINKNLDLNITSYITFNWGAVAEGVSRLGGIDVEISKGEFYYINAYITDTVKGTKLGSYHLEHAGMNHLDGVQAVAYARIRYTDSDFARTERQRKVLSLAFDKAKQADIQTLTELLVYELSMVATNMTFEDLIKLVSNINHYSIGETIGFPMQRGGAIMGNKGDCVIPQTLVSNVEKLHEFFFGTTDYQVSNTVKEISARIASDTGLYTSAAYIESVGTDSNYVPSSSEDETDEDGNVITREYETDEDGNVISSTRQTDEDGNTIAREYETDEDGRVIIEETDEDGNTVTKAYETDSYGRIIVKETDSAGREVTRAYDLDEDGNFIDSTLETDEDGNVVTTEGEIGPGMPSTPSTDTYGPGVTASPRESSSPSSPLDDTTRSNEDLPTSSTREQLPTSSTREALPTSSGARSSSQSTSTGASTRPMSPTSTNASTRPTSSTTTSAASPLSPTSSTSSTGGPSQNMRPTTTVAPSPTTSTTGGGPGDSYTVENRPRN